MIPEWVKLYLNYNLLLACLLVPKEVKELFLVAKRTNVTKDYKLKKILIMGNQDIMNKVAHDNANFISYLKDETLKVETFAFWKFMDLKTKTTNLA
jgi:hypothetical protein